MTANETGRARRGLQRPIPPDVANNLQYLLGDRARLAWYLRELHDIGCYTYRALSAAMGFSPARARQLATGAVRVSGTPAVEPPPPPPPPPDPPSPVVTTEIAAELATLQAEALKVRGRTPRNDPKRAASEKLSHRLHELTAEGATYRELADALGVRPGTVLVRLQRHGYRNNPPSRKSYGPDRAR